MKLFYLRIYSQKNRTFFVKKEKKGVPLHLNLIINQTAYEI